MTKKLKPIPKFKNEDEEDRFWSSHNSVEYIDYSKAKKVKFTNLKPSSEGCSKYWHDMCNILDNCFPKNECKERGRALVLIAHMEMLLSGRKFDENGEPIKEEK